MADQETSHIMWIVIVVTIAAAVFLIARPELAALAEDVFEKTGAAVEQMPDSHSYDISTDDTDSSSTESSSETQQSSQENNLEPN